MIQGQGPYLSYIREKPQPFNAQKDRMAIKYTQLSYNTRDI